MQLLARGEHPDPFAVLGPHEVEGTRVVRALIPDAREVWVVQGERRIPMQRAETAPLWQAAVPDPDPYRLRARYDYGDPVENADAYAFASTLGELDLHLLGEGRHRELYRVLGAHPLTRSGVNGTRFAVWAPSARRVSVVGDFNRWDGRRHAMRLHPGAGVWEIFVPGVAAGAVYKYEILPREGPPFLKSDPLGFQAELRPATASIVAGLGEYAWGDAVWMERELGDPATQPMAIYELHPGSWRRGEGGRPLNYRELAEPLAEYVREMGFTHVELLPVMEHPYDPSWGYQVIGYFAPTSRYGAPDDLRHLIDTLHRAGIGVLLDWVPAHFPRDEAGLRRFDGSALYEHADPRQGEHPDWGTLVFNFGRNEVRNFLVANALYWLREFHLDGLRVDAVASMLYLDYSRREGEWIPNPRGGRENLEAIAFLRELNTAVREECPRALTIAEESTAWPGVTRPAEDGGLGFSLKWNMGWMNDFLRFMAEDPVNRKHHLGLVTFSLMYAFSERFVLPLSHDEVVHGKGSLVGKMPGDAWQRLANLRLALGFMWGHPGKKLLFMGGELAQWREWSEERALDWHLLEQPAHAGVQRWIADLGALYGREPALWELDADPAGWEWIDFSDAENTVVSFLRRSRDGDALLFVCNFTPVPRHGYRIGVPAAGEYRELLNSDATVYGGSGVGNADPLATDAREQHGREQSLALTLPPLGMLVLKSAGAAPRPSS
ncbi:1,4-alpha-glucan branching protein GlgB [soil metagenome]